MIVILPLLWVIGWLIVGLVVGALSGLSPDQAGLELFLVIFLGGGIALPIIFGLGMLLWRRFKDR